MLDPEVERTTSLAEVLDERRHLMALAARIGSPETADHIVAEAYRRWYLLVPAERAAVALPEAWLSATVETIGRGVTPGPATDTQPASARLAPVAFVMPRHEDPFDMVTRHFAAACEGGDSAALRRALIAEAVLIADGGGKLRVPTDPVHGSERIARFLTGFLGGRPRVFVAAEAVNGRAGLVLRLAGQVVGVASLTVAAGRVHVVWLVVNPDKLRGWQ
ncbi:sigma-70 family RNA polymerase sigma factor family protein [Hamadaea flava]|uniref:hypothetical protein n=1 Tax=Hamadaea flava TaxID=1742688 RepID=UPI0036D23670